MNELKIVVIGQGGSGKSALTIQLTQSRFIAEYDPTIEDYFRKKVVIDEETCLLNILDTACSEEYHPMLQTYIRSSNAFVIVYAIDSRNSFDEVSTFCKQITGIKDSDDVPMVIVGNKNDLEKDRKVSRKEAKDLAKSFNCRFIETSAKTNTNVEEAFFGLVREIRRNSAIEKPIKKDKCTIF
ncbi:ras gtpase-related [Anaeramoeba flamelloides]|uniref:Ras gtpase-related n=1 Tax=Anaeramoeba flamelloides TaxID=1746091 RepID=A0ABQ8YKC1_9EUKA|nr:ras gtpase-related [Anaeramoeba flamelloides]